MDIGMLVKRAKSGDKEALVELVMLQKNDYYRLAFTYVKNNEDAMDAIEDMIVILYENIYKLKKEEAFYSWSKTILVNCCKKLLRKRKNIVSLDEIEGCLCEESFTLTEDQIVLEKHLLRLNEKHREILRLKYYLDLDNNAISAIMKIPIGTVKSRISIGLKKLRDSLGGEML